MKSDEEIHNSFSFIDVLKNRNYFTIWLGKNISYFGNGIHLIALIWFVFELTGSALNVGVLMVVQTIPIISFGMIFGALADRTNKKYIIVLADFGRAMLVFLLFFVSTVYQIYLIAFCISLLRQLSTTSRLALIPTIIREDQLLLANSLYKITSMIADVAGPAMGGIIVGFMGVKSAFFIDAMTYICSGALILTLSYEKLRGQSTALRDLLSDVKNGLVFVWDTTIIRFVLILIALLMFSLGFINVLGIVYVKEVLSVGAEQFGFLASSQSLGSFLAALFINSLIQKMKRSTLLSVGIMAVGCAILLLGLCESMLIAVISLFFAGMGMIIISILVTTIVQQESPKEKRGRAIGALMTVINSSLIISMGLAGYLGDLIGVQVVFFMVGTVVLIFSAVFWVIQSLWIQKF
jgi:MFS family permease